MKNVLGIVASPRRLGNCEIAVKEIGRSIPQNHRLHLLRLSDFHIKPCRGCYLCLFKKQRCVLKDDLARLISAIADADALVVAVPTYFLAANATLKRLLDRGLAFYAHLDRLWGKPAVGIGIAGIEGKEGYTRLCIESFLKLMLTETRSVRMLTAALPGELCLDGENMKILRDIGRTLFTGPAENIESRCPACGGSSFRFLGDDDVLCLLCSNRGTVSFENGTPVFHIEKDGHGLFFTREDAVRHRDWLRQQVARYGEQRDALKKIAAPYREEGEWIKPAAAN